MWQSNVLKSASLLALGMPVSKKACLMLCYRAGIIVLYNQRQQWLIYKLKNYDVRHHVTLWSMQHGVL